MGADSMKRAYIERTRRGVFGTTAARIKPMGKTFEAEAPGPAHYQVKEKPFAPRYQQMSSNFASTSYRIQDPGDPVKVSDTMGSCRLDHRKWKPSELDGYQTKV